MEHSTSEKIRPDIDLNDLNGLNLLEHLSLVGEIVANLCDHVDELDNLIKYQFGEIQDLKELIRAHEYDKHQKTGESE